uniref:Peptidase A2 domain-containing protein n=1 Tax=Strongyloides venezuelensis TaxID=75913 RepID=A0A0K0F1C8_STRVS
MKDNGSDKVARVRHVKQVRTIRRSPMRRYDFEQRNAKEKCNNDSVINVKLNKKNMKDERMCLVKGLVDTGSTVTIISKKEGEYLGYEKKHCKGEEKGFMLANSFSNYHFQFIHNFYSTMIYEKNSFHNIWCEISCGASCLTTPLVTTTSTSTASVTTTWNSSLFDKFALCSLPDYFQKEYEEVKESRSSVSKKWTSKNWIVAKVFAVANSLPFVAVFF